MATRIRLPAARRREQIVKAVLRIIGERGLTSLSTSTLAREVGVTTGALFRHFKNLDEILLGVVEYALLRIEETFPDESLGPRERLFQLARNRVRLLRKDPGLSWVLRSEQAYLTLPEDAVRRLRDLVGRSKRYLLEALRDGAERGSIRNDIEPEILLVLVMGTIHTLAGMPGVHRLSRGEQGLDEEKVLLALERVLAPVEPSDKPQIIEEKRNANDWEKGV